MKKILLILSLLLFSSSVISQIVYRDIQPDATSTLTADNGAEDIASIDFNNDGTEEYNFRWDYFGGEWFVHITFATENGMNLNGTNMNPYGARYLQAMNLNTPINTTANWGNSFPEPLIGDTDNPNFQGLGDKYIGVKFKINEVEYYGWILVAFDNDKKLTIKEYAYNSTPNEGINAGDKGQTANNPDIIANTVKIYPNPATDRFTFENIQDVSITKITISDITGKLVYEIPLEQVLSSKEINISALKNGVYIVSAFNENQKISSTKLIKS